MCTKGILSQVSVDTLDQYPSVNSWLILDQYIEVGGLSADYWLTFDQVSIECQPRINWDVNQVLIKMSIECVDQGYWSIVDCRCQQYTWFKYFDDKNIITHET